MMSAVELLVAQQSVLRARLDDTRMRRRVALLAARRVARGSLQRAQLRRIAMRLRGEIHGLLAWAGTIDAACELIASRVRTQATLH
jgi:hypothetical protein